MRVHFQNVTQNITDKELTKFIFQLLQYVYVTWYRNIIKKELGYEKIGISYINIEENRFHKSIFLVSLYTAS